MDDEELRRLERESGSDPTARLKLTRERNRKPPLHGTFFLGRVVENYDGGHYGVTNVHTEGTEATMTVYHVTELNLSRSIPINMRLIVFCIDDSYYVDMPMGER